VEPTIIQHVIPSISNEDIPVESMVEQHSHTVIQQDIPSHSLSDIPVESLVEHHPNSVIQQDLDLWNRIREYDQRSAAEPFTRV